MNKASKLSMKIANIFSNDSKKEKATAQMTAQAQELEAQQEKARKEILLLTKTSRCGFPYKPTCVAYDCVQHILAIGTKYGYVKLFGGESVEYTIFHGTTSASSSSTSSSSSSGPSPLSTQSFGAVSGTNLVQSGQAGVADKQTPSGAAGAGGGALASAYMTNSTPSTTNTASLNFGSAVQFMAFVINEGALITYCDDTTITFWNLRQKQPGVLFTRKLVNEK